MKDQCGCREQVLKAALEHFARRGYSGASIQEIVSAARLTKPTLYYYFKSKEGLFNALLDSAYEEFFKHLRSGAARTRGVEKQLIEVLTAVFKFANERKDLTRLAFASAFATPGDIPVCDKIKVKRRRNFEFVHQLVKDGIAAGELNAALSSRELAYGIYGALSFHVMANLLMPGTKLNRATASRIVALFMDGARRKSNHKHS
ncbi:MAG TPA: TetR/AcrR family transcriptional regulator [Verrucomicrobiae bacterium]|nr:TetR/AcrR family transcriptional regulator [Verrucomicrobiae bacterium]